MTPWEIFLHNLLTGNPIAKTTGCCEYCGAPIELKTTNGQARRFCNKQCQNDNKSRRARQQKMQMVRSRVKPTAAQEILRQGVPRQVPQPIPETGETL